MKSELTPTQIDALYGFVSKKGVKPLDVQIELVDHLATDIETRMEADNSVTFEDALEKSFSRGFDTILQKAEQNVHKHQSRPQYATGRVLAK